MEKIISLKKCNIKKIIIIFFIFYALFFAIGGISAPLFAHFKLFSQADSIYQLFHRSCHQDAMRCFWVASYQMALCARCLGAYIGTAGCLTAFLFGFKIQKPFIITVFIISFGEILLEFFKIIMSNNYIRFFSGICLGIFFAIALIKLLYRQGNKIKEEKECIKD